MKPGFIIIGAAKSGTTSLARYLNAHPSIQVVGERLEFFGEYSNPRFEGMGIREYEAMMSGVESYNKIVGEKSVSYLYSDSAYLEIAEYCPDVKLIVILRNPTERAYSDYWHRVRTTVESLSFGEALSAETGRISNGERFELHYATYGLYAKYLKRFIETFGREKILILFYEDLKNNPADTTQTCFDFLEIDSSTKDISFLAHNVGGGKTSPIVRLGLRIAQNKKLNMLLRYVLPAWIINKLTSYLVKQTSSGKYPDMRLEDRAQLVQFFEDSISELEEPTGRNLREWCS